MYKATANMNETPVPYAPQITHALAKYSAKSALVQCISFKIKVTAALKVIKMGQKSFFS